MKKTLGIIIVVFVCIEIFIYWKQPGDTIFVSIDEADLSVKNNEVVSQQHIDSDVERYDWDNRTKVYMRDSIVNGRFNIAPLGISLDPAGLPDDSAYSYSWPLNDDTVRYVEFEAGGFTKSYDDSCLGGIKSIKKSLLTDDGTQDEYIDRYPKTWMATLAQEGKVKDVGEYYILFESTDHPCAALYSEVTHEMDEAKIKKMSQISQSIEKSVLTAEAQ